MKAIMPLYYHGIGEMRKEVKVEQIGKTLANLPRGKTTPKSKTYKAPPVIPIEEKEREGLRKSLRVTSFDNTFDNFDKVKGTEKALTAASELTSGATHLKMVLIYGGVGNGKTYLCEATAIRLLQRGIFCRVITMADIMRILKSCMGKDPLDDFNEVFQRYCSSSHLIIDDAGMGGSGSEWEYGQLEEIVQHRYSDQLFNLITTNRDLKELPERIVSRFRDQDIGLVVLNEAEDYRPLKGKRKKGT